MKTLNTLKGFYYNCSKENATFSYNGYFYGKNKENEIPGVNSIFINKEKISIHTKNAQGKFLGTVEISLNDIIIL